MGNGRGARGLDSGYIGLHVAYRLGHGTAAGSAAAGRVRDRLLRQDMTVFSNTRGMTGTFDESVSQAV